MSLQQRLISEQAPCSPGERPASHGAGYVRARSGAGTAAVSAAAWGRRAGLAAVLVSCFCQISTDVPLHNNPPHVIGESGISKTLLYPDSVIGIFSVEDLNDTCLSISMCLCRDSSDTSHRHSPAPWIGSCDWLLQGLGIKQAALKVDPCRLGFWSGFLHFTDPGSASATLPFSIAMLFVDSLRKPDLNPKLWVPSSPGDSSFITFNYSNNMLEILFDSTGDSSAIQAGFRSRFRMAGDLAAQVHFQLRNDMRDGFEFSFFLSTSESPGPWDGEKAGFFIAGLSTHIRLTCLSVNMQTDSRELPYFSGQLAGRLALSRNGDTVNCSFIPVDPRYPVIAMNSFIFPQESPVYLHFMMKVADRKHRRHCDLSNILISEGLLRF